MGQLSLFNESDTEDIESSTITLSVYPIVGGFLPNWELHIREEATAEEILALRDGIELVSVQFEKMMDILLNHPDES